ncbi:Phosphoribulokinase [Drechslerella dactyloides]|uniref:Uridine kinase n=1 Tax=Drechslerella dactyloides TaxID=74499 RepID=A0AAD6J0Q2_DREDA|nr:Phosphoribulokinase [Drechslerella dactyloides]
MWVGFTSAKHLPDELDRSDDWIDTQIIGIAGSSGSGKTSVAAQLVKRLNLPWVVVLSMDSFYKELNPAQSKLAFENNYDFDAPTAIDFDILVDRLQDIKAGKKAEIPVYSFEKHQRERDKTTTIYSCHVLILEGIFALYDPRVLELLDMKIFVDTDSDICLARRLARDVKSRGRDVRGALQQWHRFVKPNFELYVRPQMKNADIAIPRGIDNITAIGVWLQCLRSTIVTSNANGGTRRVDMVVKHIQRALRTKSEAHLKKIAELGERVLEKPLTDNVTVLEQTPQLRGIHTILQDRMTNREDFIFYFDRLSSLLVEKAMDRMTFTTQQVLTPLDRPYMGLRCASAICGVVILRSGGVFEIGLKRVVPDCKIGRLLLQSNIRTGEPELHHLKVPPNIGKHQVLLLDPQIASGAAALMAVRVLKDHGVEEGNIVFLTYMATKVGLGRLNAVFPELKIVAASVEEEWAGRWIDEKYFGC